VATAENSRNLVLQMSISVDAFVAGPEGELDWIFADPDPELTAWTVDSVWQAGVHAMGSATYREMAAHWPTSTEPYAAPMNELPKVVFSKSLTEAPWGETRIVRGDLVEEVGRLKAEPGNPIMAHGGARFARALCAAGLVDEYRLRVHPVALGAGLPLFSDLPARQRLELVDAKAYGSGVAVHIYRPT